jgi:IclR family acetate operon transcriptional repressor
MIEMLSERGPLSPAEIALATGVARSSVYRLAEGLTAVGLAEFLPDARIALSNRWLRLADAVLPGMREWSRAEEVLQGLAASTGQTIYVSALRASSAVCIAWAQGRGIDLLVLKPGRTLPLYAGGAGRNILAHSPQLVDAILAETPLPVLTSHTLVTERQLRKDIANTLALGYTVSDEDVTVGIGAIGVPVFGPAGYLGCLSAAGLAQDMRQHRDSLVVALRAGAVDLVSG